jgi:urease accessory protein
MPVLPGASLLLADGRFPSGGHAHSSGYEAAARRYGLATPEAVAEYLQGRLVTTGTAEATLVAAAHRHLGSAAGSAADGSHCSHSAHDEHDGGAGAEPEVLERLDHEVTARLANRSLRELSRSQGRQWLRAGRRIWPSPLLDQLAATSRPDPHQVVAFAAVARTAGLDAGSAALVQLHHLLSAITTAAVRVHGLDPFEMQVVQRHLLTLAEAVATEAVDTAGRLSLHQLPAPSAPLSDLLADDHANWSTRLFRS